MRGAPQIAVLSQAIWRSAFGGRPDVVGRLVTLADHPVRVVGIARAGFDVPTGTDVWTNLQDGLWIGHPYEGWVRARPGTSLPLLVSRMNQTFIPLAKKYPDLESNRRYTVTPLLDATVGSLGPILVILFGATALLLLLAVVTVTNLMLARTTSRAREMAVARRSRQPCALVAQLLTESVLVAVFGAAAGSTLAWWAIHLLLRYGAAQLPRHGSLSMDFSVIVFVAALAGVSAELSGSSRRCAWRTRTSRP